MRFSPRMAVLAAALALPLGAALASYALTADPPAPRVPALVEMGESAEPAPSSTPAPTTTTTIAPPPRPAPPSTQVVPPAPPYEDDDGDDDGGGDDDDGDE